VVHLGRYMTKNLVIYTGHLELLEYWHSSGQGRQVIWLW